ncbi:MAG: ATP-binding protein [Pedobacter sp.]|nr:MAG: ATP-binding protein [Pedobacter sp.]
MKTDANGCSPVCTAPQIRRYLAKTSGPLLDRLDIHIEMPRLSSEELIGKRVGETNAQVRRRVVKARDRQLARMGKCNGQMKAKELREHCDMDESTN